MHDVVTKTQIVLHHTVGGSAQSTFEYWQSNTDRIGVAYILDRDGTIYEVFDPHYWAWHLGLTSSNNRVANQRSIGIEIASEGALRTGSELNAIRAHHGCPAPFDAQWLYAFDIDPDSARPPAKWFTRAKKLYMIGADLGKYYVCSAPYRGYMYFDAYDAPQRVSVVALVDSLCDEFHIPRALPEGDLFAFRPGLVNFNGVVHHAQVRADKSDLHPGFDFSIFNYKRVA
jgi:hypothetical protein